MPPTTPHIELSAVFLTEKIRRDDWIVGEVFCNGEINGRIEVVGTLEPDAELVPHIPYLFSGHWKNRRDAFTKKTSKQFAFSGYARQQPYDRAGTVAYLKDAGQGNGFGHARAVRMWDLFGAKAIETLREMPEVAAAALTKSGLRLSVEHAVTMAEDLRSQVALEACNVHLTSLLAGRGFRKELPRWLIRDFGASAATIISTNPFEMIKMGYTGCGFKLVDALWLHLKLPADSLIRQAYCVLHAIESEQEGSTWIPRAAAEQALKNNIGSAEVRPAEAIQYAIDNGLVSACKTAGVNGPVIDRDSTAPSANSSFAIEWLASKANADNERALAEMLVNAMAEPCNWPDISEVENIDKEQPDVLRAALSGPIAILGGGPGTGKTRCAANLIKVLLRKFGEEAVGIGAPTNLAAQRLSQVMADYGVGVRARTNHSLLGKPNERGRKWRHHEANPLPFKVLVFDESSMLDLELAADIFRARAAGTLVLLIGDIRQLPPVGRGAPLRDLIAAGLPYGELTEIRRNSGGIVEACAAIAAGKPWGAGDNLEIIQVDEFQGQMQAVIDKLKECREAGFDPVWDSRVIVAKNETRRAINKVLQGELNHSPPIDGTVFRIGDKVICRDNKEFKFADADPNDEDIEFSDSGKEVKICNGELGKVLEVQPGKMIVEVFCPTRVVVVPLGKVMAEDEPSEKGADGKEKDKTGTGCAFDLAYAVTFHSSQGSEFPWPILVASTRDGYMGSRELVYTGISRGKAKCKMIGMKAVWDRFCKKVALTKRKTFLREFILREIAKRELAGM